MPSQINIPQYFLQAVILILMIFSDDLWSEQTQAFRLGGHIFSSTPPYRWYNRCEERHYGSSIQVIKKIFSDLDTPLELTPPIKIYRGYSKDLRDGLKQGDINGALAVTVKPDAAISYSTIPTIKITNKIYSRKNHLKNGSIEEVRPLVGGFVNNFEIAKEKLKRYQWGIKNGLTLEVFKDANSMLKAIKSGKIDYMITSTYSFRFERKDYDAFRIPQDNALEVSYYLAMASNDPFFLLMPKIDQALKKAYDNGQINRLNESNLKIWLKQSVSHPECVKSNLFDTN